MKVIIAGSRTITDHNLVVQAVKDSGFVITELICGCADGSDKLGYVWARDNHVPVHFFPAWENQWAWAMENIEPGEVLEKHIGHYGKRAGFMRNLAMAEHASALVLVWSGQSPGSRNMKALAQSHALEIYERIV